MALESFLREKGVNVIHLDGDKTREGLCKDLGFSEKDRWENLRRVAEVNKLFLDSGFNVINSFICPLEEYRYMVKSIVGTNQFVMIYLSTPLEVCESRDMKGNYQKARNGLIKEFTGISAPFEIPAKPDLIVNNGAVSFKEAKEILIKFVVEKMHG